VIEWLFLLLPLAAASGWWAAKRDSTSSGGAKGVADPAYFHGLNYLLDDQPDKAIDVFLKLAEVDSEAAEIQLALGGLFRRRGEVDRAIRVHQSLVARPGLDKQLRAFAVYELGQDYMRAGLFDRAESLFNELVENRLHRRRALEGLLEIYQQEKEWRKCMEVADRLQALTGTSMKGEIAHYHCELAEDALKRGDDVLAQRCLREAQEKDAACVRASLLQAQLSLEGGDIEQALTLFRRIAKQDARLLSEIIPLLLDVYRDRSGSELLDELHRLDSGCSSAPLTLAMSDATQRVQGAESAVALLTAYLQGRADVSVLARLLEIGEPWLARDDMRARTAYRAMYRVVRHLEYSQSRYQCDHCGFAARRLHWQCPSCKRWGSIQPVEAPLIRARAESIEREAGTADA